MNMIFTGNLNEKIEMFINAVSLQPHKSCILIIFMFLSLIKDQRIDYQGLTFKLSG